MRKKKSALPANPVPFPRMEVCDPSPMPEVPASETAVTVSHEVVWTHDLWDVDSTWRKVTRRDVVGPSTGEPLEEQRQIARLRYCGRVVYELEGVLAEDTLKAQAKEYNKRHYMPNMKGATTKILADYSPGKRNQIMLENAILSCGPMDLLIKTDPLGEPAHKA